MPRIRTRVSQISVTLKIFIACFLFYLITKTLGR